MFTVLSNPGLVETNEYLAGLYEFSDWNYSGMKENISGLVPSCSLSCVVSEDEVCARPVKENSRRSKLRSVPLISLPFLSLPFTLSLSLSLSLSFTLSLSLSFSFAPSDRHEALERSLPLVEPAVGTCSLEHSVLSRDLVRSDGQRCSVAYEGNHVEVGTLSAPPFTSPFTQVFRFIVSSFHRFM